MHLPVHRVQYNLPMTRHKAICIDFGEYCWEKHSLRVHQIVSVVTINVVCQMKAVRYSSSHVQVLWLETKWQMVITIVGI